jgi:hypothetical protein
VIYLWLDELSDLIAETTTPDVPTHLGETSADDVLAYRIVHDHYEDEEDAIDHMPYFVVNEMAAHWNRVSFQDLEMSGVLELTYFETATKHLDLASVNAQHTASKRTYLEFLEAVIESIAQRQDRSPSLLPISRIEMVGMPYRTPIDKRDPDRPETDYWQMTWAVTIGQPE